MKDFAFEYIQLESPFPTACSTRPAMQQESDKEVNYVHQSTIMTETIKKELKHQKLFVKYGINPFKKGIFIASINSSRVLSLPVGGQSEQSTERG